MRISGEANIQAPMDQVWWALNDPAVLVRAIPGCDRLEETGPDTYRLTLTAGVATIRGTYDGEMRITEQAEPTAFAMRASGTGVPGSLSANVNVRLAPGSRHGTRVTYDGEAEVGGVLGGIGRRVIGGIVRRSAAEFFSNVEDVLTGKAAPHLTPAVDGELAGLADRAPGFAVPRLPRPAPLARGALDRTFPGRTFSDGAAVGAVGAIAGVFVGWLIGRRR